MRAWSWPWNNAITGESNFYWNIFLISYSFNGFLLLLFFFKKLKKIDELIIDLITQLIDFNFFFNSIIWVWVNNFCILTWFYFLQKIFLSKQNNLDTVDRDIFCLSFFFFFGLWNTNRLSLYLSCKPKLFQVELFVFCMVFFIEI